MGVLSVSDRLCNSAWAEFPLLFFRPTWLVGVFYYTGRAVFCQIVNTLFQGTNPSKIDAAPSLSSASMVSRSRTVQATSWTP